MLNYRAICLCIGAKCPFAREFVTQLVERLFRRAKMHYYRGFCASTRELCTYSQEMLKEKQYLLIHKAKLHYLQGLWPYYRDIHTICPYYNGFTHILRQIAQ